MPVYLVLDASASMPMEAVQDGLEELINAVDADAILNETVWLSVLVFSDGAEVVVPMCRPTSLQLPRLRRLGGTAYGPVLELLRERIPDDVRSIRDEDGTVYRPLVFFVTDGVPSDINWEYPLNKLTDEAFRYRPRIVAVGIGDVDPAVLRRLGGDLGRGFLVSVRDDASVSVRSALQGVTETLVSSATSTTSSGRGEAVTLPQGWIDLNYGDASWS